MGERKRVGIGITTRNRRDKALQAIENIKKFSPDSFKIVVVDDQSDIPFPNSDFRFEERAGVAKAKNKCFELLKGCTDIFLFDDDTFPINKNWYKPYLGSKYKHLQYIFEKFKKVDTKYNRIERVYSDLDVNAYSSGRGCMLYFREEAIQPFDESLPKYGFEHTELSRRIASELGYSYPFMDVKDSSRLIHSMDEQGQIRSTFSIKEKLESKKFSFLDIKNKNINFVKH